MPFKVDLQGCTLEGWKITNALYDAAEQIDLAEFAPINIRKLQKATEIIVRRYREERPDADIDPNGFNSTPAEGGE